MNHPDNNSSMSQKIFQLNLPVETTSIYLLCCGLTDNQKPISIKNIQDIWNGSYQALVTGLENLEKRNILVKIISDQERNTIYKLADDCKWQLSKK